MRKNQIVSNLVQNSIRLEDINVLNKSLSLVPQVKFREQVNLTGTMKILQLFEHSGDIKGVVNFLHKCGENLANVQADVDSVLCHMAAEQNMNAINAWVDGWVTRGKLMFQNSHYAGNLNVKLFFFSTLIEYFSSSSTFFSLHFLFFFSL